MLDGILKNWFVGGTMIRKRMTRTPEVDEIILATFPDVKLRQVFLTDSIPDELRSYWDDGNKSFYKFLHFTMNGEKRIFTVQSNHPYFEADKPRFIGTLPPNTILVEYHVFGRNKELVLHVPTEMMTKMIESGEKPDLSTEEKIFLHLYNVLIPAARFPEINSVLKISKTQYDEMRKKFYEIGLMNKRFALTLDAKNMIDDFKTELWNKGIRLPY